MDAAKMVLGRQLFKIGLPADHSELIFYKSGMGQRWDYKYFYDNHLVWVRAPDRDHAEYTPYRFCTIL